MASIKFNPFTNKFDYVGSGSGVSYIDGEVADSSLLPVTLGTPAIGDVYLAKAGSGVWLINRRPAGLYSRTANNGNLDDWTYLSAFPEVQADSRFRIYNATDATKEVAFDVSAIAAGTTRTISVPNKNITLGVNADWNASSGDAQILNKPTLGGWAALSDGAALRSEYLTISDGEQLDYIRFSVNGVEFFGDRAAQFRGALGLGTAATQSFASPPAIGSTTRNSGAFTTLNANNGTLTASAPVLDLSQTWNNAAVTFTGLRLNITDTASAAASNLLEIQVGGVTRMMLKKNGTLHLGQFTNSGFYTPAPTWHGSTAGLLASTNFAVGSSLDLIIERDGADIWAQRRTTNPQTFRLYNTFTDVSNYERGFMRWSSNVLQIGTEKAGTGSARNLEFHTDNTFRARIQPEGLVLGGNSNSIFLGNPRIYGSAESGLSFSIAPFGAGNVIIDSGLLKFHGVSSSFPALKRSSTTLQVRLADDSAYAPLEALSFTTANSRIVCDDANTVLHVGNTPRISLYGANAQYLALGSGHDIRWSSTGRSDQAASTTIQLARDADGILAQRAGTTAQTWRLYNTVSGTNNVNFDRVNFRWASNEFIIDAEAGGTGTLRGIKIGGATSSLLGFYGVTPVDRPDTVSDAATQDLTGSDTLDKTKVEADLTSCKTAINAVIDRLQELGLIA